MNTDTTPEPLGRLLATITRDVLRTAGPFASLADLSDAVKRRCNELRIRWTNDAIADAYRLIDTNTPLVQSTAPPAEPPADVPADPPKAEARAILDNLRATFGAAPRVMPSAKPSPIDIYADVERDDVDHDRY